MRYKLGEICTYIARGITPKYSEACGICVLNQKCIRNGVIDFENSRLHDNKIKKISFEKTLQHFDILINSTGVGTAGRLAQFKRKSNYPTITVDGHITIVRPNLTKVYPEFLGYFLQLKQPLIESLAKGSTGQTEISRDSIFGIDVDLPDFETQQKIVRILSTLDSKIELNNQQNQTLEKWLIEYYKKFSQKLNNDNSSKQAIGKITDCKLGGTPSRTKLEYWGGEIAWINSGAINSFRIDEASEMITEEGFKHTSTYLLPKGTTVLAITGATLGQVSRLEIEACANQSVIGILENDKISNEFIYLNILNNIQNLINKQTGGAQQHINKNDVLSYEIILPSEELMDIFTKTTKPIFKKISNNCFENKNISQLRDALLPKLMNGEIDLGKITIQDGR